MIQQYLLLPAGARYSYRVEYEGGMGTGSPDRENEHQYNLLGFSSAIIDQRDNQVRGGHFSENKFIVKINLLIQLFFQTTMIIKSAGGIIVTIKLIILFLFQ
jgi:hypothetical protein